TTLEDLAGRALQNRFVRVLRYQTSYPACFSTSLEDLAGRTLVNNNSLEDLAGITLANSPLAHKRKTGKTVADLSRYVISGGLEPTTL
ncbi:MAG: hypothetical protein ACK45R_05065, partial [Candidatus Kapaibacterium sp.]